MIKPEGIKTPNGDGVFIKAGGKTHRGTEIVSERSHR
jgi:hypothetical protein